MFISAIKSIVRDGFLHPGFHHRVWAEIVQREDACYGRCDSSRNLGVADIGKMSDTAAIEPVDFTMKGGSHLSGCAAEIDEGPIWISNIDGEPMGAQPRADRVEVLGCEPVLFAKLLGSEPAMEVRRTGLVKVVDERLQSRLLLRRTAQLQQQMGHGEVIGHRPQVAIGADFATGVAGQGDKLSLVDGFPDLAARRLCMEQDSSGKDKC